MAKKLKWMKSNSKFIEQGAHQWSASKFIIEQDRFKGIWLFCKSHYGADLLSKFKKLSTAKRVAQLIHEG